MSPRSTIVNIKINKHIARSVHYGSEAA